MWEAIKGIGNEIAWLVGFIGICIVIWGWVAKPLKEIRRSVGMVSADIGDILCDRLNQAYDYWMKKGWCPKADKTRLVGMFRRYKEMGRNHLADNYANDLIRLPEHPPDGAK